MVEIVNVNGRHGDSLSRRRWLFNCSRRGIGYLESDPLTVDFDDAVGEATPGRQYASSRFFVGITEVAVGVFPQLVTKIR